MLRQLGLVVPKTPLFQRSFNTATYLRREYSDKDWQPNLDNVVNQAVAQEPANNASVPNSMLASFKNMFDRGPNVGIEVLTTYGFVLSNNVKVEEPVMLINGSCFLWNAPPPTKDSHMPMQDWDLDTFKIFELVSPKPEIIMFGTGKNFAPVPEHIRKYFFKLGVQVDQMNTKHAAATYNVLAEEGRRVAAAFLPLNEKEKK